MSCHGNAFRIIKNNKMTKDNHIDEASKFGKDFFLGCFAITLIGVILFVLIPILIFVLKVSLLLVIPIGFLIVIIVFIAFFGRIIRLIRKKW